MSFFAPRMSRFKPSPSQIASQRVRELRAQGRHIVKLTAGEPDFPTPGHVKQAAIEAMDRNEIVYSPINGTQPMREAVQAFFPRLHINGGTFDVEILYYAHRLDLPIYFQPVEWRNAPGSTISPWRCLVQDPIDMVRIRLRDVFDRD